MSVYALVSLPFGVDRVAEVTTPQRGIPMFSALIGVVLANTVDTLAAGISSVRFLGALSGVDPVSGSFVGALFMWIAGPRLSSQERVRVTAWPP